MEATKAGLHAHQLR